MIIWFHFYNNFLLWKTPKQKTPGAARLQRVPHLKRGALGDLRRPLDFFRIPPGISPWIFLKKNMELQQVWVYSLWIQDDPSTVPSIRKWDWGIIYGGLSSVPSQTVAMDQNGFGWFPMSTFIRMKPPYSGYLVGGFEEELMFFHFMMMGCHPNPIDFHSIIFQDGHMVNHQAVFYQPNMYQKRKRSLTFGRVPRGPGGCRYLTGIWPGYPAW